MTLIEDSLTLYFDVQLGIKEYENPNILQGNDFVLALA